MSLFETQDGQQNSESAEGLDTQAAQSQESEISQSKGTTGTEPAEAQPQVYKDMSDEEIESSNAPASVKRALRRANRRLQKERQATAELRAEVDAIKQQLRGVNGQSEAASLLKEIKADLDLDDESSAKFLKAVDKIVTKKVPQQAPAQSQKDRQSKFVEKVQSARNEYEDWDDMAPFMHKVMESEMRQLQQLGLDPEDAYDQSVHQYYAKAVRLKAKAELEEKQKLIQGNANNRATTESSKAGQGKPVAPQRITQEVYEKNRRNPQWVRDNYQAIVNAASQGLIRSR